MKKQFLAFFMAFICCVPFIVPAAAAEVTEVALSQQEDEIQISGKAGTEGTLVTIVIRDPEKKVVFIGDTATGAEGRFTFVYPLLEGAGGTYSVELGTVGQPEPVRSSFEFKPDGNNRFLSFSIAGNRGVFNGNKIVVTTNQNYSSRLFAPHFSVSQYAVVTVNGEEQISGQTKQDFANTVTYTVTAQNGAQRSYQVQLEYRPSGGGPGGGGGGNSGRGDSGGGYQAVIPKPDNGILPPIDNPDIGGSEPGSDYVDLQDCQWAADDIAYLTEAGIVSGKGNGIFAPWDPVTREEFVKMVVETFALEGEAQAGFDDVEEGAWYAGYIEAALSHNIIKGKSETWFGIGESISRQDMTVILYQAMRSAQMQLAAGTEQFADGGAIASYAKEAVSALHAMGIVNGVGDGKFDPEANANRAQAAKVVAAVYRLRAGQ